MDSVSHDSRASAFVTSTAVLLSITLVFYALRLYVRTSLVRSLAWDDTVLGFAMVSRLFRFLRLLFR